VGGLACAAGTRARAQFSTLLHGAVCLSDWLTGGSGSRTRLCTGCVCPLIMIRTEVEMNRNVGESQPSLLRLVLIMACPCWALLSALPLPPRRGTSEPPFRHRGPLLGWNIVAGTLCVDRRGRVGSALGEPDTGPQHTRGLVATPSARTCVEGCSS
jgi:hypothetical protein